MIQWSPSSYLTFCSNCMASASAEVAGLRRSKAAHTGTPAQISYAVLVTIKTYQAKSGGPALIVFAVADCITSGIFAYQRRGFSQYSSCNSPATVFACECSSGRSSKFCASGAGSSCHCNGPRSANSCSSNWSPGPRGKDPNTPLRG